MNTQLPPGKNKTTEQLAAEPCTRFNNCWGSLRLPQPTGWKMSMEVMSMMGKYANLIARVVLIFFGVSDLIGILWFQQSLNNIAIVLGFVLALSELCVGVLSKGFFTKRKFLLQYQSICVAGFLLSIVDVFIIFNKDFVDLFLVYTRLALAVLFLTFILVNKKE